MDASSDGDAPFILPHRAYRRPIPSGRVSLVTSVLLLSLIELLIAAHLEDLAGLFSRIANALAGGNHRLLSDYFLGARLAPLALSLHSFDFPGLGVWFAACVIGVTLLAKAKRMPAPPRFMGIYNLTLIGISTAYILIRGRLGYDAPTFSRLYLHTAVVIWLIIPLFVGTVSIFMPFRIWERLGLVAASLAYNFVFSAIRYAAFAWLLRSGGGIIMADLYLFFGPLLDFVYIVGIFSLFLVPLSRRLARRGRREAWTWL